MDLVTNKAKNTAKYLVPLLFSNLIPFIVTPLMTRALTPDDYGALALAVVYASFVGGIASFGMAIGFERNFFQYNKKEERLALLFSVSVFSAIIASILFGITWWHREFFANFIIHKKELSGLLLLVLAAQLIDVIRSYFLYYFRSSENVNAYIGISLGSTIISTGIGVYLIVVLHWGVNGLGIGNVVASLVTLLVSIALVFPRFPTQFDKPGLFSCIKLSLPLTPRIFLKVIGTQFDKYILGLLGSRNEVGIYSMGQRIGNLVYTYMSAIENVFTPAVYSKMFNMPKEEGGRAIGKYLTPFAYISTLVAVGVCLLSEEIVWLLTPREYHKAVWIVFPFTLYYGAMFFGKQPQLVYAKKTGLVSILSIINVGVNIGVVYWFVHLWGSIGAAYGTLLVSLAFLWVTTKLSQHYYKIYYEYKKIIPIFGILVVATIGMSTLCFFNTAYSIKIVFKAILMCAYVFVGIQAGIITKANIKSVMSLLPFTKNKK